ncbi:hypothetical protein Tco_0650320, partial [Tanacetum coccineum]
MAALKYKDDHNKIAYLGRERGCEDFTYILSYLDQSPLRYALTHAPPVVFDSLVKQFWATSVVRPNAAGSHDLVAIIDGREVVVTESLIRTQLQFDDANGIFDMPNNDILEGMRLTLPQDQIWTSLGKYCQYDLNGRVSPIPLTTVMLAIAAVAMMRCGWVVPKPVYCYDWRPWPYVPVHSPIRDPTPEPESPPTPPAENFIFEEPLVFGPEPRPDGYVDLTVIEPIIYWPTALTPWLCDPDFVDLIFGPQPRPDNYLEPEDLDNIIYIEDDTTHGGFHVESPVRPDDAPTPTADAAGRAEDPALLTGLSAKLDRCMGRIDSLETELGNSKKIMGGAILTLVSRVKKLEKTVKQLRETRLVVDASAAEGDVDIQDDIDLDGLSRIASTALGHDQPAVPSKDVEEREEVEVPLRCKRSAYRRASEQFQANLSAGVLPHTAVPEPAGPFVAAAKGKVPMPDLDIPVEFLAKDAQARKRFEEEQASERLVQRLRVKDLAQDDLPNVSEERAKELDDLMMRMTETDWLNLMLQVDSNLALARELLGADVNEEKFIERMTAVKERKKRALADLRYRALKDKPIKKSEVTQMMRNLVKNQWCAAHNAVPAATTLPADDPDSAGGGSSNPAGSAT